MRLIRLSNHKEYLLFPDAIWDGAGDTLLRNRAVHIKDGLICRMVNLSDVNNLKQAENVTLPELTLLPGLIDCHIHLSMDSRDLQQAIREWSEQPEVTAARIREELDAYLACGIVAVRDGGDINNFGLTAKKNVSSGDWPGPKVIATGQAIYRKEKYGAFLGPGISSLDEVEPAVRQLAENGVDQLKVVVSGLVSFKKFGVVGAPQFNLRELTEIVDIGHAHGLKVMAHASSDTAVELAAASRVDSVEHGYFVSDRTIALMAEKGTAWVPTFAPLGNLVKHGHIPYPGANLDIIKSTHELQLIQVAKAAENGVLLGIGTDAGANMVFHGSSYFDELNYFHEAGISLPAILRASTVNAAKITGLDGILGTVKPGRQPSLVGVHGNPLENLSSLRSPAVVILAVAG